MCAESICTPTIDVVFFHKSAPVWLSAVQLLVLFNFKAKEIYFSRFWKKVREPLG
jgi:hypothetical protein